MEIVSENCAVRRKIQRHGCHEKIHFDATGDHSDFNNFLLRIITGIAVLIQLPWLVL